MLHTGQTILTLAALVLLSTIVFNFNKALSSSDVALAQNRYRLEALSILNSHIEQASQHYFDEASNDTVTAKLLTDFVTPGNLGLDGNDAGVIDDFDDYHNLAIVDTGRSGVIYQLRFLVDYVRIQGNAIQTSGSREYHKRMTVMIMDNYPDPLIYHVGDAGKIRDTLRVEFVHSYWFYN